MIAIDWYIDSGATQHMSDQHNLFINFCPFTLGNWLVKGIGSTNMPLQAQGKGDIRIRSRMDGIWHEGIIKDVVYVPNLGANLFSVRSSAKTELVIIFLGNKVNITRQDKVVAVRTSFVDNLYHLDIDSVSCNIVPEHQ